MPRGIDHLVIAVRDLDAARATYQRLGFTLTPEARHPFGTKNALVQLNGAFLELVAMADLATTQAALAANGVPVTERLGRMIVAPSEACGVTIAFAAEASEA